MSASEKPAAFPSNHAYTNRESGMTLRDYYAGQIMAGFCANPAIFAANPNHGWGLVNCVDADLVGYAGKLADDMLEERRITKARAEHSEGKA